MKAWTNGFDLSYWNINGVSRKNSFEYSSDIAKKFSPHAAILLGWFLDRFFIGENPNPRTEEVEATIQQICEGTGMNRKRVLNARADLHGVLRSRHKRLEHRTFYSIDVDRFEKILGGAK